MRLKAEKQVEKAGLKADALLDRAAEAALAAIDDDGLGDDGEAAEAGAAEEEDGDVEDEDHENDDDDEDEVSVDSLPRYAHTLSRSRSAATPLCSLKTQTSPRQALRPMAYAHACSPSPSSLRRTRPTAPSSPRSMSVLDASSASSASSSRRSPSPAPARHLSSKYLRSSRWRSVRLRSSGSTPALNASRVSALYRPWCCIATAAEAWLQKAYVALAKERDT